MSGIGDLEIGLYRWDSQQYAVDLRYDAPAGQAAVGLPADHAAIPLHFDLAALRELQAQPEPYGEALWQQLFADPLVQKTFDEARSQPGELRVRLYISPSAPELHDLCWEALRDPRQQRWLATDPAVRFSRYIISASWGAVPAAPEDRRQLRAVVAVAAPTDLDRYSPAGQVLAPVPVRAHADMARQALAGLGVAPPTELTREAGRPATLNGLIAALGQGCDVLCLACHGALLGQPVLWLESEAGPAAVVTGLELTERLRELEPKPRLVVLASCQSAGTGADESVAGAGLGALAALGPHLVAAGVPAVVAMQGNVSMDTVALFLPAFFAALRDHDGRIDQAVATARGALLHPPEPGRARPRHDWRAPVLFMRLKHGNLWGGAGFTPSNRDFPWQPLLAKLRQGTCTALLGSGLLDGLLGPTRQIARRLAEAHRFPLAPHDRDDLPQVTQFLKVASGDDDFPYLEVQHYLARQLRGRYAEAAAAAGEDATLDELIVGAGQWAQQHEPREPHALLAALPFPLFVTTNPDGLLPDTLARTAARKGQLKVPQVRTFLPGQPGRPLDREPGEASPLVYYLFGRLPERSGDPPGWVLTEDDYFNHLLNVGRDRDRIPTEVRGALVNTSLVCLGFRVEEWDLRILARTIEALGGSDLQRKHLHVAVQLAPGDRIVDLDRARSYLERLIQFRQQSLSIYWGTLEAFLAELTEWYKRKPA